LRAADIFLENSVFIETGPHKHAVQQTFFLYVYEPGGNRVEVANAGARLILAPDWKPIVWTEDERKKGQAWGLKTIESCHTYGTPPVDLSPKYTFHSGPYPRQPESTCRLDMRNVTRYARNVIRSIRHKGLKRLHEDDDPRGVLNEHAERLRDILARLDAAGDISDMDLPGFRLHPLKGELRGFWAVTVRANWRVIFRIVNRDTVDVEYIDYH
jgi:plasmid maintenance system killer protein